MNPVNNNFIDNNSNSRTKVKVLVVEDHLIAQKVAQIILQSLNCDVDIIGNSTNALKLFIKNYYDLIFIDVGLPDLDGFNLTTKIRNIENKKSSHPTAIIGLSVHISNSARSRAIEVGMNDYLLKPLTADLCKDILYKFVPQIYTNLAYATNN